MRQPDGSLFTAAFVALTLSDLAYFTGSGALIGVTPFFVTVPLGSEKAGVGVAVGAFSVTTLLLRPLAGRWTDRHGRRPLLIAGAFLFAVLVMGHLLVTALSWRKHSASPSLRCWALDLVGGSTGMFGVSITG